MQRRVSLEFVCVCIGETSNTQKNKNICSLLILKKNKLKHAPRRRVGGIQINVLVPRPRQRIFFLRQHAKGAASTRVYGRSRATMRSPALHRKKKNSATGTHRALPCKLRAPQVPKARRRQRASQPVALVHRKGSIHADHRKNGCRKSCIYRDANRSRKVCIKVCSECLSAVKRNRERESPSTRD